MKRWAGWACFLVLAATAIPILRYVSYDHAVFGRWSRPYFALVCVYAVVLLTVLALCFAGERVYRSVFNRRLAYVLAMGLLALVTGEAASRVALRNRYIRSPSNFVTRSRTSEYDIEIRTNSRGFRDREHSFRKPAGRKRIAVVGDSFVWGSGVQAADAFPNRLESDLNREARGRGDSVEVLSFGVSGTGPVHYLKLFRGAVRPYHPDLVIVSVYAGNDLKDALHEAQERTPKFALRAFLAAVFRHGKPVANTEGWAPIGSDSPVEAAALMQAARERGVPEDSVRARLGRVPEPLVDDARAMRSNPCNLAEALLDPDAIRESLLAEDPETQRAWPIVDRALGDLDREIRRAGGRMVLLIIPAAAQVDRAYWGYSAAIGFRLDDRFLSESPVQDHLTRFAASRGIDCIDLLPVLRSRPEKNFYFVQDGHWTPEGHRVAAEVLAERLKSDAGILAGSPRRNGS